MWQAESRALELQHYRQILDTPDDWLGIAEMGPHVGISPAISAAASLVGRIWWPDDDDPDDEILDILTEWGSFV